MSRTALRKAVRAAGGQKPLAAKLAVITGRPISQAHVWNWLNRDARLPAEMAAPIELAVGGAITRHELRPDLYPLPPQEDRRIA